MRSPLQVVGQTNRQLIHRQLACPRGHLVRIHTYVGPPSPSPFPSSEGSVVSGSLSESLRPPSGMTRIDGTFRPALLGNKAAQSMIADLGILKCLTSPAPAMRKHKQRLWSVVSNVTDGTEIRGQVKVVNDGIGFTRCAFHSLPVSSSPWR